ncbi:hypothetical protein [Maricaulis sp.]|uniref:hypothetical protein n=1 Tax=Maricaulis sp. TaxID=1486257 RepID=UPI0025C117C0|nr:hypothetical protein [Maricaulis sp.]
MTTLTPRLTALFDLVLVVGIAIVVKAVMMEIAWKYAGPVSLLCAVILASWLIHRRGKRWSDYGL